MIAVVALAPVAAEVIVVVVAAVISFLPASSWLCVVQLYEGGECDRWYTMIPFHQWQAGTCVNDASVLAPVLYGTQRCCDRLMYSPCCLNTTNMEGIWLKRSFPKFLCRFSTHVGRKGTRPRLIFFLLPLQSENSSVTYGSPCLVDLARLTWPKAFCVFAQHFCQILNVASVIALTAICW